jgi:hypothetical protein
MGLSKYTVFVIFGTQRLNSGCRTKEIVCATSRPRQTVGLSVSFMSLISYTQWNRFCTNWYCSAHSREHSQKHCASLTRRRYQKSAQREAIECRRYSRELRWRTNGAEAEEGCRGAEASKYQGKHSIGPRGEKSSQFNRCVNLQEYSII